MNQFPSITAREKEIINFIAYEFTSEEIAKELFLSKHTIETHRKNLLSKMDVKNVAGLIRKSFEQGYINQSFSTQEILAY